jgi:hypothetical protein
MINVAFIRSNNYEKPASAVAIGTQNNFLLQTWFHGSEK